VRSSPRRALRRLAQRRAPADADAALREREVENRVQVSETEVDVFLEQQKSRSGGRGVNLAHILVRVPEGASPERIRQARERAEQALAEVKGGAPFARVAASFSDAPDALQGGAIGWRSHDRLPELFSRGAREDDPGEVQRPRAAAGFQPPAARRPARRRGPGGGGAPDAHAPHLIRTSEAVSESEARRKLPRPARSACLRGRHFAELALRSAFRTTRRRAPLGLRPATRCRSRCAIAYEELKFGDVEPAALRTRSATT